MKSHSISPLSTWEEAAAWRDELTTAGQRVVFTNGVFDLLHVGHARYLQEARDLGDALIIAINGDDSVRELKGEGRPLNTAADRAELLLALECVDRVVVFEGKRCTAVIDAVRPQIYAKGGDYTVETLNAEERGAMERASSEIHILSLVAGKSTSATLAKLAEPSLTPRIAVLGSGRGSNFQAIVDAIDAGTLVAEVGLVISDVADSGILNIARERNIPALCIDPADGGKRGHLGDAALKEIVDRLRAARIDLVALAGFLRIVREPLLSAFPRKMLNIHPSLLPKYPGLKAWEKALAAGETNSGCTVHYVDAGIDSGEILAQEIITIDPARDTAEDVRQRIQACEHTIYPRVIGEVIAT